MKILGFVFALLIGLTASARAEDDVYTRISKHCQSKFQALADTGVTSEMRESQIKRATCLETAILSLAKAYLFENEKDLKSFEDALKSAHAAHARLAFSVYNENKMCQEAPCGTMWQPVADLETAAMMDSILKTVTDAISSHELGDARLFETAVPQSPKAE